MTNLEKEEKFLKLSEEQGHDKATVKPIGKQSVQITLPCGCKQTQHFFAAKRNNPEAQSIADTFIEFCNQHS